MDLLPDELLLLILSYLPTLTDSIALSRVNKRFNYLFKQNTWRRRLVVTKKEIDKTLYDELRVLNLDKNILVHEVKRSTNLTMLSIERFEYNHLFSYQLPNILSEIVKNCPKLNTLEFSFKCEGIGNFSCFNGAYKFALQTSFNARLQNPLLQQIESIIENSKFEFKMFSVDDITYFPPLAAQFFSKHLNSVEQVVLSRIRARLEFFTLLGNCPNLSHVTVLLPTDDLRTDWPFDDEPDPPIKVKSLSMLPRIYRIDDVNRTALLQTFLSSKLKKIWIKCVMVYGIENIIFIRCPNLECIKITTSPLEEISEEEIQQSYMKILALFKESFTVREITIDCGTRSLLNKLRNDALQLLDDICYCNFDSISFEAVKK